MFSPIRDELLSPRKEIIPEPPKSVKMNLILIQSNPIIHPIQSFIKSNHSCYPIIHAIQSFMLWKSFASKRLVSLASNNLLSVWMKLAFHEVASNNLLSVRRVEILEWQKAPIWL